MFIRRSLIFAKCFHINLKFPPVLIIPKFLHIKVFFIQVLTKTGKFIDLFPLLILKGNSWVWAILYDQNDDALQKNSNHLLNSRNDQE